MKNYAGVEVVFVLQGYNISVFWFPPLHPPVGPRSQSGCCEKKKRLYKDAAVMQVLTVGDIKLTIRQVMKSRRMKVLLLFLPRNARHCFRKREQLGQHKVQWHTDQRVCMYVWVYVCMYASMYVCMCVRMYYVIMYVYTYVIMYACMYVNTSTYTSSNSTQPSQ